MDRKDRLLENSLKSRMWDKDHYEVFESYAKGNSNTRKDAETSLQEYAPRFKWSKNSRALDIGSGDGSVTTIVAKHIPRDCELVGSDINEKIVKYANEKYGNQQIKFIRFDVVSQLPEDMKGKFDHVFSMYLFHWVRDHKTAFTNIYNILPKNGEFFTIFLANSDIYSVYQILAKRDKWAPWMKNINTFLSPYHEYEDPEITIRTMLKEIGFESVDVTCKQRKCSHESIAVFKALLTGINSFNIPEHMWADFLDEYINIKRCMNLIDETDGSVKTNYNLMVVHCVK